MIKLFFTVLLLSILFVGRSYATDRCIEYTADVRSQHVKRFGYGFPYQFGLGQLKQESGCRANATAWDLGQGVAQFMPKTAQYINSLMKMNLNPYNPQDAIHMQAFYMALIYRGQKWSGKLWTAYQEYNGGLSNLSNEYKRAGTLDWQKMKDQCKRKKVTLKNGSILDFCEVNYDYSKRIDKYGEQFEKSLGIVWDKKHWIYY